MEEERRSQEERQLEDDERLARLLSEELVSVQTGLLFVLLLFKALFLTFLCNICGNFAASPVLLFMAVVVTKIVLATVRIIH